MAAIRNYFTSLVLILSLLLPGFSKPSYQVSPPSEGYVEIVEKYREIIQDQMRKQGITGFAIALVTDKEVLWTEGFGCTDRACQTQVTPDTPFSIQSMSKSMTATAVLLAVEEGLLDLDVPITTYLPDFSVHSIFDERPQDMITLRMLLSHTAGFTHEAPVGNNNNLDPGTWEAHIASISDTWLKYPVGQGYSYANLGIDLAGYILEQAAEMPFQLYLKTRLFEQLGMENSTFDTGEIERQLNRAIGQSGIYHQIPPITPMIPSGGAFTSANDMARYLQFHINRGRVAGQTILVPQLIELMYKSHFQASEANNYGLGLYINKGRFGAQKLRHNGGGFGYYSQMVWYPDLKIGVAWLSNSQENEHDLINWLSNSILEDVINAAPEVFETRASAHPFKSPVVPNNPVPLSQSEFFKRIQQSALEPDPLQQLRWREYAGCYSLKKWGQAIQVVRVRAEEQLEFNGYPVVEVEPGLFIAFDGEAIDFRGDTPTVSNLKLDKNSGLLQAQKILLRVCGIGFLLAILWNGAWFLKYTIQRRNKRAADLPRLPWLDLSTRAAITLGSILALGTLPMLIKFSVLLFNGTPLPQSGLHVDMMIGFSMVYGAVGLSLLSVLGMWLSWRAGLGTRLNRILSSVFTGILVLFSLLVVA